MNVVASEPSLALDRAAILVFRDTMFLQAARQVKGVVRALEYRLVNVNTNLTGIWTGECVYDPVPELPDQECRVSFTLHLRHGWFGRLSGFIKDDPEKGAPEPAPLKGKVNGEQISFVMYRPVYYVMVDQKMITLEEYIKKAWDMSLDSPVAPYSVSYEGTVSPSVTEISGKWQIPSGVIQFFSLGRRCEFPGPGGSGRWKVARRS